MTQARMVVAGDVVNIARRCVERTWLLRPEPELNQAIKYLLAYGAIKYHVLPIAAAFMSDHYHLQAWDREGQHPKWTNWFNKRLADFVNHLRGRSGSVFDGRQVNVARVLDDEAMLDSAAYILSNPVKHGATSKGCEYPGVRSTPQAATGKSELIERPESFSKRWPDAVELKFYVPPTEAEMTADKFTGELGNRVGTCEAHHREKAADEGREFMGAAAVLAADWSRRSKDPKAESKPAPEVVARDKKKLLDGLKLRASFRKLYRAAVAAFRTGKQYTFPKHTWNVAVRFGLAGAET